MLSVVVGPPTRLAQKSDVAVRSTRLQPSHQLPVVPANAVPEYVPFELRWICASCPRPFEKLTANAGGTGDPSVKERRPLS